MTCYIITFEVKDATRLANLKEKIQSYKVYCPIHDNCWAIITENSAVQIRDYLNIAIAPMDRVFVIKSGVEAAWNDSYGTENADWLKAQL